MEISNTFYSELWFCIFKPITKCSRVGIYSHILLKQTSRDLQYLDVITVKTYVVKRLKKKKFCSLSTLISYKREFVLSKFDWTSTGNKWALLEAFMSEISKIFCTLSTYKLGNVINSALGISGRVSALELKYVHMNWQPISIIRLMINM